jgi:hypothetical protein
MVKLVFPPLQEQKFLSIARCPGKLIPIQAPVQWLQGAKRPGPELAINHLVRSLKMQGILLLLCHKPSRLGTSRSKGQLYGLCLYFQ